ncbi:MAG: hypothetical protein INR71_05695 [Terriglobus roseus]|nr:hypothetical protein [Terriglobus roseus]
MAAQKIDGTAIAKGIRERLAADIQKRLQLNPRFKPCLRIVQGLSPGVLSARKLVLTEMQ